MGGGARAAREADGLCPAGGERKEGRPVEGWKWRVAEPHTATCGDLLSSPMANTVPVLTRSERSGSRSASREQPAKGQR